MLLSGLADTAHKKTGALFNLTRYFSITCALALGIVTLVLTFSIYYSAKHDMTHAQEKTNIFLTQNIGNSFWPLFADYISAASVKNITSIEAKYQTSGMHEIIKSLVQGLPVLKVKIYNLHGLTIYSSDHKQIGEIKQNNQALFDAAQHGIASSKLTYKESIASFSGEVFERDVIESYIPIGRKPNQTEAIFEIYTDATESVRHIWYKTFLILFGLILTLGSLYGVLLVVVRRADSIMREQFSELEYKETGIRLKNNLLEQQIEEREIAEQAVRDSEARFRTLFEDSNDAILVIDPVLKEIINLNNKAVELLEYSRDEYQALTIADIHPNESNEIKQFLNTVQINGSGKSSELHCLTKSGRLIPTDISASLTKLDDKPVILVHINDITQRIEAEKARHISEERFRGAIESLQEGFALFDDQDKLVSYNDEYVRLHEEIKDLIAPGVRFETLFRAIVAHDVYPEARGLEEEFIRMRLQMRRQNRFGSAVRNLKNGLSYIVRENHMADGGIFITYTDITQIQNANLRLRQGEARFRSFVEQLPFAVSVKGIDDEYQLVNESFEEWYGVKGTKIIGKTPEHVFAGQKELLRDVSAHNQSITADRPPSKREAKLKIPGHEERILELTKFPILGDNGEMVGIGTIGNDITDRKKAEESVKQSEAQFRALIDNIPARITLRDLEGQYLISNQYLEDLHGNKLRTPQNSGNLFGEEMQSVIDTGKTLTTSRPRNFNDGSSIDCEVTKFPVYNDDGQVVQVGSITFDITERKEAEETIKQSEAQFRGAVESLQEGFALFDADNRLVAFNEEFVRIHNDVTDIIQIGMHHEDLFRTIVHNGFFPVAKGKEEEFIRSRMKKQQDGTFGTVLREASNGMSYIIKESRTSHGDTVITLTDVTELRKSQERFQILIEQSNVAIYVHRNFKPLMANPATAKMYGYDSVEDFLQIESTRELTAPEYRTNHLAEHKSNKQAQTNNEHLGIKKDGSNIWVRKRTFTIDWDGAPAVCSIREDITLAKESENALKASEERFRGAIESLQEGFALYDADDRLVMCNDQFRNSHAHCLDEIQPGSKFEDMVRKNAYSGHNTNAAGQIEKYIDERIKNFGKPKGPIIRNSKDGTVRIISEAKMPDGSTTITQTDVTEIVKAEEEAKRQKSLFQAAINNAPYAFVMTNMQREVVLCNPAFSDMFGYEMDEIIGQSTEMFYQNHEEFKSRGHLRNLLSDSDGQSTQQLSYKRKNGEVFTAQSALAAIGDAEEKVFGYIVIIQDITDRLKQEEETQRYQEIISNSRRLNQLGEMAAGLAHELNQPLAAITNYTEGCIQRLNNKVIEPAPLQKALTIVSEQADRAGHIINRIRGFVKKEDVKKDRLNVEEIINEILELTRSDLERRNIALSVFNEEPKVFVTADKIQIQQVILNLIRNASDAMDSCKSSECTLTLKTTLNDDNAVEISVTDTGPGIPIDKLNKIFDPFFTTKSNGLGLGLNICQSIIESHGGRMWATNNADIGATIHFTLPALKSKKSTLKKSIAA